MAPVSLWPNVLAPLPLGWKLSSLLLWPALGTTIASAYVLALLTVSMRRLKKTLIGGWDFFVALWRIVFKTGMPVQIINFVTAVCNLRCTHCFYKEALDSPNPGDLVLMISIDGPKEQDLYPHFNLTITTTVQPDNTQHFPAFVDELVRDFNPRGISINLFRYHALEHPPIPEAVLEAYRLAVLRYEEHLSSGAVPHYSFFGSRVVKVKDLLQKELLYRVAKTNEFVTPCTSGTLSYVIWEDGRVGPCEVLSDDIGRIGEGASFRALIKAKQAKTLRKWVDETQCRCTYECAQGNNAMFSWPMTKHLARGLIGKRRLEL